MKRQILICTVLACCTFLSNLSYGQTPDLFVKPQKNLIPQNLEDNSARLISPNSFEVARNNVPANTLKVRKPSHNFLGGTMSHLLSKKGVNRLQVDPNAGSKDPGIFYAPIEKAVPASNILKPLKEVDSLMAVDPKH